MNQDTLQNIVKTLQRDLDIKRSELSRLRLVTETMSEGLHDPDYFIRVCGSLNSIFQSSVTSIFWMRKRTPPGWWLGAWSTSHSNFYPMQSILPHDEESLLDRVWNENRPKLIAEVENDAVVRMWGGTDGEPQNVLMLPLKANGLRSGMLVALNPKLSLEEDAVLRHLEILQAPINSGIYNRLLYKTLQDSEEELRDLFDNASDMIVVAYHDGIIRDCNQEFINNLRLESDPRGQRLADLVIEEEGKVLEQAWARLLAGDELRNLDIRLKRTDGSILEAELSGNTRSLLTGRPGIIRLYLRDMTERRTAERKQRELELEVEMAQQRQLAQLGLYVSGIAHNLQNPVQVLLGYISLLKNRGTQLLELDEIEKSTERIMGIIRNLLHKMRQERSTDRSMLQLNELLQSELTFLDANLFYKNDVEKDFSFDDQLPEIEGLYSDFSQSIMNIIYNALEAMVESEERTLSIQTQYDTLHKAILIRIGDSGVGIPKEVQEKIFAPFFTTKDNGLGKSRDLHGGTGLGLSSSLALLKPYGGTIEFDSAPGEGTTFTLKIPVGGEPK